MRPEGFNARKISDVVLKDWDAKRMVEDGEHLAPLLVEAGADAYEEAIWKMARESPTGTFIFDTNIVGIPTVLSETTHD